ncbi:MFS transporter [Auraticoccus cholistanensis]|nr:MFS transporter [Auraticoccus cholistanensis]
MDGQDAPSGTRVVLPAPGVAASPTAPGRAGPLLCWLVVVIAGYHLVVLGATIPSLIRFGVLGFTPAAATLAATASVAGMAVGAAAQSRSGTRHGRRQTLAVAVATSSAGLLLTPLAPDVTVFVLLRLLGGLGLGLGLPVVLGVAAERGVRRLRAGAWVSTGYHAGAVAAAVLGLVLLPDWRPLFVLGGVAGLVLLPLLALWRPVPAGSTRPARGHEPSVRALVSWQHRWVGVASVVASFMALALVHGLNTWLPTLMRAAGHDRATSLQLLLVLNVGAALGLLGVAAVSQRLGGRRAVLLYFGLAAVGLALLGSPGSEVWQLVVVVLLTGAVVASTQALIQTYVARVVPPETRTAANGLVTGLGRVGAVAGVLGTGLLISSGLADPWAFHLLSAVALLGVLVMVVMTPRTVELAVARPAVDSRVSAG